MLIKSFYSTLPDQLDICWLAQITIPKVIFLGPQKETADSNTFVQLAYYLHSSKGIPETDKERKAA